MWDTNDESSIPKDKSKKIQTTFQLKFDKNWFKKDDILTTHLGVQCKVIKVYNSWWRRLLYKIGIKRFLKINVIKVKYL